MCSCMVFYLIEQDLNYDRSSISSGGLIDPESSSLMDDDVYSEYEGAASPQGNNIAYVAKGVGQSQTSHDSTSKQPHHTGKDPCIAVHLQLY